MSTVVCWFQRTLKQLEREQTDTQTHTQDKYRNPRACAPRVKNSIVGVITVDGSSSIIPIMDSTGPKAIPLRSAYVHYLLVSRLQYSQTYRVHGNMYSNVVASTISIDVCVCML